MEDVKLYLLNASSFGFSHIKLGRANVRNTIA